MVPFLRRALPSMALAVFPKCPLCWAAYLSMSGIAGLEAIPYSPWLKPLLALLMSINLFSVWLRSRSARRWSGFCWAAAGALAIVASRIASSRAPLAGWGVALTMAGSLLSVLEGASGYRNSVGPLR